MTPHGYLIEFSKMLEEILIKWRFEGSADEISVKIGERGGNLLPNYCFVRGVISKFMFSLLIKLTRHVVDETRGRESSGLLSCLFFF